MRFGELIDELTRHYLNERSDIIKMTRALLDDLSPLGNRTSMRDMEVGAIMLMRRSHHRERGKRDYSDFCDAYLDKRKEGLDHAQAIAKLDSEGAF